MSRFRSLINFHLFTPILSAIMSDQSYLILFYSIHSFLVVIPPFPVVGEPLRSVTVHLPHLYLPAHAFLYLFYLLFKSDQTYPAQFFSIHPFP